jgi:hypothetical protein
MKQLLNKTIQFIPYFIAVLFLTLVVITFIKSNKGNEYIDWERMMIESNQLDSASTQYFNFNN